MKSKRRPKEAAEQERGSEAEELSEEKEFEEARCDAGWASKEFEEAALGDKRLTKRLAKIGEAFGANPQGTIPQVQADASATKGAYRFLSNPKVGSKKLLEAHFKRTAERMKGEPVVLCAHDTSSLNYNKNKDCEGLGYISSGQAKGMDLHSALALTPQGQPLGLLAQQAITHASPKRRGSRQEHDNLPIEEKESYRWIQGLRDSARIVQDSGFKGQLVAIGDREADIYEVMIEARRLGVNFVIRQARPRRLETEAVNGSRLYIPAEIEKLEPCEETLIVSIPARAGAKAREAQVKIRFGQVKLKPPQRPGRSKLSAISVAEPLEVYVVCAQEVNVPTGVEEPINWILLTDVPVLCYRDAVERVEWYQSRWQIEVFHKILKTGCKIEKRMLEKFSALCSCVALLSVIAWRLYWLTQIGRTKPQAPASEILTGWELAALTLFANKKKKIAQPILAAGQAIWEIAKMGGFLARKRDGEPGAMVMWRGYQRLTVAAETLQIASEAASALKTYG